MTINKTTGARMVELLRHEFSDREIVEVMGELQFCSAYKAIMKGIKAGLDPKEVIQSYSRYIDPVAKRELVRRGINPDDIVREEPSEQTLDKMT